MNQTTKHERAKLASQFLEDVSRQGRKFFTHKGRVSRFEVDARGRVWFVDAHREARIYTQCRWSKWRGFSEGGTMREVVIKLSNFIRTGEPQQISLGLWPDWICKGDPWGYGAAMEGVRSSAATHGLVSEGVAAPKVS